MDVARLKDIGITAVLSLCVDEHAPGDVEAHRRNGITLVLCFAEDTRSGYFDIIQETWPSARRQLSAWREAGACVLVSCWAGINRSAAIVGC